MKNKNIWIGFSIIAVLIIVALIIMYLLVDQRETGTNNIDKSIWLTFWGTYVGACIGGLYTFILLVGTLSHYQEKLL